MGGRRLMQSGGSREDRDDVRTTQTSVQTEHAEPTDAGDGFLLQSAMDFYEVEDSAGAISSRPPPHKKPRCGRGLRSGIGTPQRANDASYHKEMTVSFSQPYLLRTTIFDHGALTKYPDQPALYSPIEFELRPIKPNSVFGSAYKRNCLSTR